MMDVHSFVAQLVLCHCYFLLHFLPLFDCFGS